ncbi:MAG: hypothetical protein FP825_10950 [Hyphomonas sp.]|uniref:hypothetical protein n=1 Tax=Hyphomonas sp. TaxID=87 RepID=UPI001856F8ED|nr:hypothetical protein [Hyphomonas sp.]MBU3920628.1 hypothetical protein [Alphaproteobacteria bacterium]MBA3068988.1 hypothetical protein [Hyphomonas sp.]MBU4061621.1 hypothetical protein [Alphaproteobacteria bacterium]MBU4163466.1 hypothetical protein [Alphaproteobacteria bacterium]MBU4569205.1 hypothetical protein [Alphaproteobacteria bacterium]
MGARLLFAAGAGLLVAGCQTAAAPSAPVITLAAAMLAMPEAAHPLDVAIAISDNPAEGMTENDWGGEVPQSQPAGDVNEGGLGDLD